MSAETVLQTIDRHKQMHESATEAKRRMTERHMAELVEELMSNGYHGGSTEERCLNAWAALAIEISHGLEYADMTSKQRHEAWAKHLIDER